MSENKNIMVSFAKKNLNRRITVRNVIQYESENEMAQLQSHKETNNSSPLVPHIVTHKSESQKIKKCRNIKLYDYLMS